MVVTVEKCHAIMSGNDCWSRVHFNCCRKADKELADVTLSGSLFQNNPIKIVSLSRFKVHKMY